MNKYALMLPLVILSVFLGYFGSTSKMEHIYAIAIVTTVFATIAGYSFFHKHQNGGDSKRVRKKVLATTVISMLLFSTLVVSHLVNFVGANPFAQGWDKGVMAAPSGNEPPTISIVAPLDYSMQDTNNVSLTFVVRVGESENESGMHVSSVYCTADWVHNVIKIYNFEQWVTSEITQFHHTLELIEIPAGNHSITVHATEMGKYYFDSPYYYRFYISNSSTVNFSISTNSEPPQEIPEFPSWMLLVVMLLAVMVLAIIYRRSLPKLNQRRREK